MERQIRINEKTCIRCRCCEQLCPSSIFSLQGTVMTVDDEKHCIGCGQCAAACPPRAVLHPDFPESKVHGYSLEQLPDPGQLMLLMKARHSNRAFSSQEIPQDKLRSVIEAAYAAPTAQNSRNVRIIAVTDPKMIRAISTLTVDTFASKAHLLENPFIKCLLHKKLASVYAMIPKLKAMHRALHEKKKDPVLHEAKAVLFFCAPADSRFGREDCNLAYQNASLMAESLGIAQFYTGFVLSAIPQDKKQAIARLLDLKKLKIFAGMALGIPRFRLERFAERHCEKAIIL